MIEQFKYINNLGRFEAFRGASATELKPFTLIYSENGRGKTTLCSLLRSLSSGDAEPLLARKRVSSTKGPHAVVIIDGEERSFDGNEWSGPGPTVVVFDDHFTAANVCSGLEVGAGHRQKLHELVVGEEGVRLQRRVEEFTEQISAHHAVLREKGRELSPEVLGGYALDEFCGLAEVENVDEEILEATKSAAVLRNQEKVRVTAAFSAVALPTLPVDEAEGVLGTVLEDLDATSLEAVTAHFERLGGAGERWVSEGLGASVGEECPFCGQGTDGVDLVAHYRNYFSEAYAEHKGKIGEARAKVHEVFGGDRLARYQRLLAQAAELRAFWADYIEDLPDFDVDPELVPEAWVQGRDALLTLLEAKAQAPLEVLRFDAAAKDAFSRYGEQAASMLELSTALLAKNEEIASAKEHATHGNLTAAEAQLRQLEASKRRYEPEVAQKCEAYTAAKAAKERAEADKDAARKALDEHRGKTFGKYQTTINKFLGRFNADFRLEALEPSDPRGIPTSTYAIGVNKGRVPLSSKNPEPSFSTALSAGDRNTLALALFFAKLSEQGALDGTVVVIDDPVTSLDDGRRLALTREIRKLLVSAQQVIVLSHASSFLCHLWDGAKKDETATLSIEGHESSTLKAWNAEVAAETEYDRLHKEVADYAENGRGNSQQVAQSLRRLLEGYCRVAFARHLSPKQRLLGEIVNAARQAAERGQPFLSAERLEELDELREYTNQFHHTSKTWQESLANLNETALKQYARLTMRFAQGGESQ